MLTLMIGLMAGLAIGLFVNNRPGERSLPPDGTSSDVTAATDRAPVVASTAPQAGSALSTVPAVESGKAIPAIDQIADYRQLIDALRAIDGADAVELQSLAQTLVLVQRDHPFVPALNTAVYQRWAEADFSAALAFLLNALEAAPEAASFRLYDGIEILAQLWPDEVDRQVSASAVNSNDYQLSSTLLSARASRDPRQLAFQALESGSPQQRETAEMLSAAIDVWARQDPLAALAFVNSELDEEWHSIYLPQILIHWQHSDPDAALSHLSEIITSGSIDMNRPESMHLFDLYISQIGQSDPRTGLAVLQQHASSQTQQMLLDNLLYNWADSDVEDLIYFVEGEDPALLDRALEPIAQTLARIDPYSAIQWADRVPQAQRQSILTSAVSQWIDRDPDAATQWLLQLPGGEVDHSLWAMAAMAMSWRDPETGNLLYEKLPADDQLQYAPMLLQQRLQSGEASARNWVEQQSNTQVRSIGAAVLDALHSDADVHYALDTLASLQTGSKLMWLSEAIQRMPQDKRPDVSQWLADTALLDDRDREYLTRLGNPALDEGYYMRLEQPIPDFLGPASATILHSLDR
jgi:hypothetical protein